MQHCSDKFLILFNTIYHEYYLSHLKLAINKIQAKKGLKQNAQNNIYNYSDIASHIKLKRRAAFDRVHGQIKRVHSYLAEATEGSVRGRLHNFFTLSFFF